MVWRLGGNSSDFKQDFDLMGQHDARLISHNDTVTVLSIFDNAVIDNLDSAQSPSNHSSFKLVALYGKESPKRAKVRLLHSQTPSWCSREIDSAYSCFSPSSVPTVDARRSEAMATTTQRGPRSLVGAIEATRPSSPQTAESYKRRCLREIASTLIARTSSTLSGGRVHHRT